MMKTGDYNCVVRKASNSAGSASASAVMLGYTMSAPAL